MKFTGAEISHRLIAGDNKEQLEVTENKILDVTGQQMSAWEAGSKSPEQLRGTNGKLFQNILYNGNANGYPMLSNGNYPTSVYPDNIYVLYNRNTNAYPMLSNGKLSYFSLSRQYLSRFGIS